MHNRFRKLFPLVGKKEPAARRPDRRALRDPGDTMNGKDLTSHTDRQPALAANHLALGLWMRGSIAGAAVALAGVASLFAQPPALPVLTALTWIAAGATFGWLCWQRASARLDRVASEETSAAAPARADFVLTRQGA
jgi:hypothetical protein